MGCGVCVRRDKVIITYGEIAGKSEKCNERKYRKEGTQRIANGLDYLVDESSDDCNHDEIKYNDCIYVDSKNSEKKGIQIVREWTIEEHVDVLV